jgi:hypothetical protein
MMALAISDACFLAIAATLLHHICERHYLHISGWRSRRAKTHRLLSLRHIKPTSRHPLFRRLPAVIINATSAAIIAAVIAYYRRSLPLSARLRWPVQLSASRLPRHIAAWLQHDQLPQR